MWGGCKELEKHVLLLNFGQHVGNTWALANRQEDVQGSLFSWELVMEAPRKDYCQNVTQFDDIAVRETLSWIIARRHR